MLCCPCQGQTHSKMHFLIDSLSLFYYYFWDSSKSKESGDAQGRRKKSSYEGIIAFTHCLSLQISSWKVMNSFKFFTISQNLNIWHPAVKNVLEFGGFVGFPPDLWSDVNITTIWNSGIYWIYWRYAVSPLLNEMLKFIDTLTGIENCTQPIFDVILYIF